MVRAIRNTSPGLGPVPKPPNSMKRTGPDANKTKQKRHKTAVVAEPVAASEPVITASCPTSLPFTSAATLAGSFTTPAPASAPATNLVQAPTTDPISTPATNRPMPGRDRPQKVTGLCDIKTYGVYRGNFDPACIAPWLGDKVKEIVNYSTKLVPQSTLLFMLHLQRLLEKGVELPTINLGYIGKFFIAVRGRKKGKTDADIAETLDM
ncbi:hypothetical protein GGI13_002179 [Coemansia sp. RSA 455]|nr:hypothetical protein GGI13_002179 [Coemansia sp. RSA 455]